MKVILRWRDDRRTTITVSPDETILEAAEANGIALPFGCRRGACASCTGRVLDGEIEHIRRPRALSTDRLDDGYALLCSAEARSDCRIEVGTDVQKDLVTNPWR